MGAITQTPIRETVVDFSYPYFFSGLGIMSKKPPPLSKFVAIVWPYKELVWMALTAATAIFIFTYWTFSKIDKEGFRQNFTFGNCVQEISQMLVMQGININHWFQCCISTLYDHIIMPFQPYHNGLSHGKVRSCFYLGYCLLCLWLLVSTTVSWIEASSGYHALNTHLNFQPTMEVSLLCWHIRLDLEQ